jgi:hypothetical protein
MPPEQHDAAIAAFLADEAPELDHVLGEKAKKSTSLAWESAQSMYVFGASSPRKGLAHFLNYHLRDGVAEAIECPTLVLDAESDMFAKGQAEELYAHLTCPKTLIRFTDAEGAGAHCQVGAHRLAFARIYDWLDETFAATN